MLSFCIGIPALLSLIEEAMILVSNLFLLPYHKKRMSVMPIRFLVIEICLVILRLALLINPGHGLHILGCQGCNLLISQEGSIAILELHIREAADSQLI